MEPAQNQSQVCFFSSLLGWICSSAGCSGHGFFAGPTFDRQRRRVGRGSRALGKAGAGRLRSPSSPKRDSHAPRAPSTFFPSLLEEGSGLHLLQGMGMKSGGPLPCAPTCPREEHLRHPLAKPPAPEGQVGRAALGEKRHQALPRGSRTHCWQGARAGWGGEGGVQEEGEGKKGALWGGPFAPREPVNAAGSPTLDTHLSR